MLRGIVLIAWFDLQESLRSRKALALLVIYLMGSMAATGLFVAVLSEIETAMAEALAVSATSKPGAMTASLMESEQLLDIFTGLIGDRTLASELVTIPPVALFYGWLAMAFAPILIVFTSADAISSELASGAIRFSLFRTERLTWALGKLGGQAMLLAVGVALGAAGVWIVGWLALTSFSPWLTAWWLARLGLRAGIYSAAFLGLIMGISQTTRSVNGARALALLALIALGIGGVLTGAEELQARAPVLLSSLHPLFPSAHRLDLWRPDPLQRLPAIVMLLALGGVFFATGHAVMARRDA